EPPGELGAGDPRRVLDVVGALGLAHLAGPRLRRRAGTAAGGRGDGARDGGGGVGRLAHPPSLAPRTGTAPGPAAPAAPWRRPRRWDDVMTQPWWPGTPEHPAGAPAAHAWQQPPPPPHGAGGAPPPAQGHPAGATVPMPAAPWAAPAVTTSGATAQLPQ